MNIKTKVISISIAVFMLLSVAALSVTAVNAAETAETTEAVTAREPKETIPPRVTDPAVTAPTGIIDSTIGVGTVPAESQPITFGITR